MQTKKRKPPARLPLSDIIRDPALAVRPVSDAVAEEYSEHLEELPPIVVWEILGKYYLADGWHRHRAHELADAADIKVIIMAGSLEQAKLFVANCDIRVGVRRTREAKRSAVLLVLSTERGANWSDREVARHCGVSHTFVSLVKARLAAGVVANNETSGNAAEEESDVSSEDSGGNVANDFVPSIGNVASDGVEPEDSAGASGAVKTRTNGHGSAQAEAHFDGDDELNTDGVRGLTAREEHGLTVGDVIDAIAALTAACASDAARRQVLNRVGDAIIGMLDELGPPSEVPEDEVDDIGIES